jgi:thiamine-phosphate pyrophosphorylase
MNALKGLYVITDPRLTPSGTILEQVDAALSGGARLVQYRDKSGDHAKRDREARALRTLCHRHGALLIINDDVDLCLQSGADGVHLGQEDTSVTAARRALGNSLIIGATCHGNPALAVSAIAEGASYVAFGRFYASGTKPGAPPARTEVVGPVLPHLGVPSCAIGGITLETAPALLGLGFSMLAVVGDVFGATDIEARCRRYAGLFD